MDEYSLSDKMPPKNLIPLEYVAKILRKNTKKEQLYLTVPQCS